MNSNASDHDNGPPPLKDRKAGGRKSGPAPDDVGKALRSAYDETVREEIPDDFLDLLGKLS